MTILIEHLEEKSFIICLRPTNQLLERRLCFVKNRQIFKNIDNSQYEVLFLLDLEKNEDFTIYPQIHDMFNAGWQHAMNNFMCFVEEVL